MRDRILMMGLTPPLEGGSERHIYELARIIECDVLTQSGSLCKNKIEVPIIGSGYLKNFSFLFFSFFYSIYLLLTPRKRYGVIHIHENLLYVFAPLLGIRYKIVITVHGIKGFKFYDNKRMWAVFRQFLKFADIIIAVNLEDKKALERSFKKVIYIPNGVDLDIYERTKSKVENKISFIGRVHEQKGIIYLLEAFDRIKDRFPGWKLEIIGKVDDYGEKLQEEFRDKRIIWKGFMENRSDIAKNLKSSYMIVLPSLWEGLPLVLFEALASGRPVIVSDIPAFKSVIKDEAAFCKVKSSSDLADKMMFLIKNKKKAFELGEKGEKLAKKYDWKEIARKVEEVYE